MNLIEFGDCRETMRRWAGQGVKAQMCVTSPPYFGLRDYGHDGQIGLEQTPEEYIAAMVEVFRCVRDVLADDGTLWLNIGDTYASKPNGPLGVPKDGSMAPHVAVRTANARRSSKVPLGLKHKDLIGIPWMLAFALRADGAASPAHMRDIEAMIAAVTASYDTREQWPDKIAALVERLQREHIDANRGGWYLRQDIIWAKPNPMPESVRDRCTKAHEYIFLLSKSDRYFYDLDASKEPAAASSIARWNQNVDAQRGSDRVPGKTNGSMKAVGGPRSKANSFKREGSKREQAIPGQAVGTHRPDREESSYDIEKRNRRSVWTVATRPYKGAHFATFPPALVEPCILAGSRPGDIVLDPFMGSGTTAAVALQHGRQYLGCELNPDYGPLQQERIAKATPANDNVPKTGDLFAGMSA